MNSPSELIAIGKIGRPHGVNGDVIIYPHGDTLEKLHVPCEITIGDEQGAFSKNVSITALEAMHQGFKCKFSDFDSPEASETLKGMFLYIPQERLERQIGNQEFYHFELKGMTVVSDPHNNFIGEVIDVHNYPTTDALEIKKENGQTFIIGLDPKIVRSINRQARIITISLDLLEEIV